MHTYIHTDACIHTYTQAHKYMYNSVTLAVMRASSRSILASLKFFFRIVMSSSRVICWLLARWWVVCNVKENYDERNIEKKNSKNQTEKIQWKNPMKKTQWKNPMKKTQWKNTMKKKHNEIKHNEKKHSELDNSESQKKWTRKQWMRKLWKRQTWITKNE